MKPWFTIDQIDENTDMISKYRHWEETHCYLLEGNDRALLIDTGLGICDISEEVKKLTARPVTAVATHIHWDHIGGHKYYPDFYAHEAELDWLSGRFPLSMETIREMVVDRCEAPEGYDVGTYEFFQGTPTRVLHGGDTIDIGGRIITLLHTPGHSPGHMCFWEAARGYLFTGDLVYKATRKKKLDCSKVELLTVDEGLCVQIMHMGPFDDGPATVALMDEYLAANGYENDSSDTRLHHEIYLSDARKVAKEKWKTIVRHPVRKTKVTL